MGETARRPQVEGSDPWDEIAEQMAATAMSLAADCGDAHQAARELTSACERRPGVELRLMLAQWRLAGRLDAAPGDLTALVALGISQLAAMTVRPLPEPEKPAPWRPPRWTYARTGARTHAALEHHEPGFASSLPLDAVVDEVALARKKGTAVSPRAR